MGVFKTFLTLEEKKGKTDITHRNIKEIKSHRYGVKAHLESGIIIRNDI